MKLWAMPWPPKMDGPWWRVLTQHDPLEKGMANHFSILPLRIPWTVWKGKKKILKDEFPRSVGAQYAPGEQWRYNSRKNEGMKPKQKQHQAVNVIGDGSKVQCCKEKYCIGIWDVRSMNQGKLQVVKQKMTSVNFDILGISELKWTEMGEFNSDDHYIYYCGQESLWRDGVAIIINKSSKCSAAAAKSLQSCLTLCDPIDGSPPGSALPGILQARTLEWVAISFSNSGNRQYY